MDAALVLNAVFGKDDFFRVVGTQKRLRTFWGIEWSSRVGLGASDTVTRADGSDLTWGEEWTNPTAWLSEGFPFSELEDDLDEGIEVDLVSRSEVMGSWVQEFERDEECWWRFKYFKSLLWFHLTDASFSIRFFIFN